MKPAPRWALPSVRPLVDHELDRRQVQAPRGAQPSRTNRPSPRAPQEGGAGRQEASEPTPLARCAAPRAPGRASPAHIRCRARGGGQGGGEAPGPIPNPEVKPASAESTAAAGPRESRAPPPRALHLTNSRPFGAFFVAGPFEDVHTKKLFQRLVCMISSVHMTLDTTSYPSH